MGDTFGWELASNHDYKSYLKCFVTEEVNGLEIPMCFDVSQAVSLVPADGENIKADLQCNSRIVSTKGESEWQLWNCHCNWAITIPLDHRWKTLVHSRKTLCEASQPFALEHDGPEKIGVFRGGIELGNSPLTTTVTLPYHIH